ncbi:MAG: polyprenyl diphosphate synthase [Bacteroidales bacterium]|nr:polyprenyl diphosphate synthase [Bacteroides sp.]MCM1197509.1 polyprenyl diphosphate synthase [Clostridium sp.]MCM1502208.1 polyprenyl diphosphate synthase [Bacteroidales bacterium]
MDIQERKIPVHVSMIMDGNGRWARERGKERTFGHAEGVESVRACTEAAIEAGVKYLSLFAFSEENWSRPETEVNFLMEMMVKSMLNEMPSLLKNGVRFRVLGNRERLTDSLNAAIDDCEAMTSCNDRLTLIVFLSYSGKWDILQAARKIAAEILADPGRGKEIMSMDTDAFSKYLVTADIPDPDLIVRTSGESRLSNYLLWQGAYSELLFTDVMWPDFRKEQFNEAIAEYAKRDRRYGKVK